MAKDRGRGRQKRVIEVARDREKQKRGGSRRQQEQ